MKKKLACLIAFGLLASAPAIAQQPWSGQVYGVYPQGVLMSQGAQTVLVPHEQASFQLGGLRMDYTKVSPGQVVQVNMPQQYYQQVQVVPNRNQWMQTHQCVPKSNVHQDNGNHYGQRKREDEGRKHGHGKKRRHH
jgi:hypothetical protein